MIKWFHSTTYSPEKVQQCCNPVLDHSSSSPIDRTNTYSKTNYDLTSGTDNYQTTSPPFHKQ